MMRFGTITRVETQRRRPTLIATLGRSAGQNSALNDGTNTQVLTRSVHKTGRSGATDIQIGVANFKLLGVSPYGEAATGGTATVGVALELADGTVIQALFRGATSIDLVAGSPVIFCDPIGVWLPPDTTFYIRTWYRVAATNIALSASQTVSVASTQIARKGTDLSAAFLTAGYPSGTTSTQIPPVAIIGTAANAQMSVVYFGDSIGDGSGDVTTDMPHGETSFIGRSLVGVNGHNLPHSKLTRGGETLTGLITASSGYRRGAMFRYATHGLCEAGTNDLLVSFGYTLQQIKDRYNFAWSQMKANGLYVMQTTIAPRVSLAGAVQTPVTNYEPNGTSLRDQLNAWFLTQVGQGLLDRAVDIRPAIEDVTGNPGYWKNGLTDTADGVHPEAVAHARISTDILKPALAELEALFAA